MDLFILAKETKSDKPTGAEVMTLMHHYLPGNGEAILGNCNSPPASELLEIETKRTNRQLGETRPRMQAPPVASGRDRRC